MKISNNHVTGLVAMELVAICKGAWLSQNKIANCECETWNSSNNAHNQINSQTADTIARYSTSVKECETVVCFLNF